MLQRTVPALRTIVQRSYTTGVRPPTGATGSTTTTTAAAGASSGSVNSNVPGLSKNCVKSAEGPVGPGAASNAEYKVPEYFLFNRFSFAEAEVEMEKFRCPQPSALTK